MSVEEVSELNQAVDNRRIGAVIEGTYNRVRDRTIKSTWQGLWDMAAGSAGRLAILSAVAIVGGSALMFGGLAAAGMLENLPAGGLASIGDGLMGGLQIGWNLLTSGIGLAAVGTATVLGGWLGMNRNQSEFAAALEASKQRELIQAELEKARTLEQEKALAPAAPPKSPPEPQAAPLHDPMYDPQLDATPLPLPPEGALKKQHAAPVQNPIADPQLSTSPLSLPPEASPKKQPDQPDTMIHTSEIVPHKAPTQEVAYGRC